MRGWVFAAATGVAVGVTFSPHGGPFLPFAAFAPLAAALAWSSQATAAPSLAPFRQGFAAAVIAHGIGLYWMVPALSWRTSLAVPTYVLVLVLIGLVAGAACLAATFLHGRKGWPLPLALAACWTGFEWVAARVPGVPYAWLNAGNSLAWHPALAAGAELLGARFLGFWTVASGACLAWLLTLRSRPFPIRRVVLGGLLIGAPVPVGYLRHATLEDGEVAARVAVVQPERSGGGLDPWQEPLLGLIAAGPIDVVAFPERFLAAPLREAVRDAGPGPAPDTGLDAASESIRPAPGERALEGLTRAGIELAAFADALGVPVMSGAMDAEIREEGGDTLWYNAAFLQVPGRPPSQAYHKARLVPGLEGYAWPGATLGIPYRGYATGRNPQPLTGDGWSAGAMICYDSAYGETARALVREGADWLMVLSNDDWLDPERPFRTTWAYWQHATLGRLRAIENRMSLIQVAATGYSFSVSPAGDGAAFALQPGVAGAAVLPVFRRSGTTLFTRLGDVLGFACFLVFTAGVLAGPLTARIRS